MPSELDDSTDRHSNSRQPDNSSTKMVTLSVQVTDEVADWLEGMAKEIGVSLSELVADVFNDGLDNLPRAGARTKHAARSTPADLGDGRPRQDASGIGGLGAGRGEARGHYRRVRAGPWALRVRRVGTAEAAMSPSPASAGALFDSAGLFTGDSATRHTAPSPFLKWPGGKRTLAPRIVGALPEDFGNYWEPFLGGERCSSRPASEPAGRRG